jgi:hypothetical protein
VANNKEQGHRVKIEGIRKNWKRGGGGGKGREERKVRREERGGEGKEEGEGRN